MPPFIHPPFRLLCIYQPKGEKWKAVPAEETRELRLLDGYAEGVGEREKLRGDRIRRI